MANQYDTFALAKTATIPSGVNLIQTLSYAGATDSGLLYRKVASNPGYSEPAAFQSADGAWWKFEEAEPNILQFGAVGDNSTVNTTSIQTALDSGIKQLMIPEGIFLSGPLTVPATISLISGTGMLKATGAITAFQAFIRAASNPGLTIRDITISVDRVTCGSNGSIDLFDCTSPVVQNVRFLNSGRYAVQIEGGIFITVEGCDIINFNQSAISAASAAVVNIRNNRINGPGIVSGSNIDILGCSDVFVTGNNSYGSTMWAVSFQNVAGGGILNNKLRETTAEALVVGAGSTDVDVAGNICKWTGGSSHDFGMSFGGTDATKITRRIAVHDNIVVDSYATGIAFAGWITDSTIADNMVIDCNQSNGALNGNGIEIAGTAGDPDSCIRNTISGNVVKNVDTPFMRYGVAEYANANYNQVSNNFFKGITISNVSLQAGGSSAQSGNITLP
jgi:polygalacturonase